MPHLIRLLASYACPRRALHFGWGQPLTHSWTPPHPTDWVAFYGRMGARPC
jgi:hypothetical protein